MRFILVTNRQMYCYKQRSLCNVFLFWPFYTATHNQHCVLHRWNGDDARFQNDYLLASSIYLCKDSRCKKLVKYWQRQNKTSWKEGSILKKFWVWHDPKSALVFYKQRLPIRLPKPSYLGNTVLLNQTGF